MSEHIEIPYDELTKDNVPRLLRFEAQAPYDGCFWEPNFWLWLPKNDNGVTWLPLYASGKVVEGIKLRNEGTDLISQKQFAYFLENGSYEFDGEIHEVNDKLYKMIDPHFWQDFVDGFCHAVDEGLLTENFVWRCGACGCDTTDNVNYTGYHGNGGIGIINTNPVCDDCFSLGRCEKCCEYYGADELVHGHCEYCRKNKIANSDHSERLEEIEDMLNRAEIELNKICVLNPSMADKYVASQRPVLRKLENEREELLKEILD